MHTHLFLHLFSKFGHTFAHLKAKVRESHLCKQLGPKEPLQEKAFRNGAKKTRYQDLQKRLKVYTEVATTPMNLDQALGL